MTGTRDKLSKEPCRNPATSMAQLSVGADAEEKTPSGLQENSIKERRPCPETNIPKFGARSSSYSRLAINLKASQLKKTPFLSCGSPKTMPGTWHPGADRLLGTGSSEKRRATFQKKTPAELQKKTAGKGPFFRNNDALAIRCKHLPTGDVFKRKKGRLKKRPLNDERLPISGAFPKITLASAYFPT